MRTQIKLLKNILKLIGVLFRLMFSKLEYGIGILILGREENNKVRKSHVNNISTKVNVCKKCTFHDVHIWKKI